MQQFSPIYILRIQYPEESRLDLIREMLTLESNSPEMWRLCMNLCKILDPPTCDEYGASDDTSDVELLTISDAVVVVVEVGISASGTV